MRGQMPEVNGMPERIDQIRGASVAADEDRVVK